MTFLRISGLGRAGLLVLTLLFACPTHSQPSEADCERVRAEEMKHRQYIAALEKKQKLQEAAKVARERIDKIRAACGVLNRPYAKALRDLADIEILLNNPVAAQELTQSALTIREGLSDVSPLDLMYNRMKLAILEEDLNRYDAAKKLVDDALMDYRRIGAYLPKIHAELLQLQARLQAWEGKVAEAEASLEEARSQVESIRDLKSRLLFESTAAQIYRDIGLLDVAERYLRKLTATLNSPETIEKFGQQDVAMLHALNNSSLARVLVRQGKHEQAAEMAKEAVQTLESIQRDLQWLVIFARLPAIEVDIASGHPAAALEQAEAASLESLTPLQEAELRYAIAIPQGQLGGFADSLKSIAHAITILRASTSSPATRLIRYLKLEAALLWASGDIRTACCRSLYPTGFSQNNPRQLCRIRPLLPSLTQRAHNARSSGLCLRPQPAMNCRSPSTQQRAASCALRTSALLGDTSTFMLLLTDYRPVVG